MVKSVRLRKKEHRRRKRREMLASLINEQSQELRQESKSVFVKGGTNSYEKSKKGIFVGNRVF